jgi:hypothetical protein
LNLEDIGRTLSHGGVVFLSFGLFYGDWKLFRFRTRLVTVAFLSAMPTWLLLPFHPLAEGISVGAAWFGYIMERGPGAFPRIVSQHTLDPLASESADVLTNRMFGGFWYKHAVLIFLMVTWCYNVLYDYMWFSGFTGGKLCVVAVFSFGYGSIIGVLFSKQRKHQDHV